MGDSDNSDALGSAIHQALVTILSASSDSERKEAEKNITALEVTEEYGLSLCKVVLDHSSLEPLRQMAAVLLRKYVETHWTEHVEERFTPPEPPAEIKRTSVAYTMASIAHWDWPEEWPDLLDILVQLIQSDDPNAVHGALRVLVEFARDISDSQMVSVTPIVIAEMLKIFSNPEVWRNHQFIGKLDEEKKNYSLAFVFQKFSVRTRSRAVEIYHICVNLITSMGHGETGGDHPKFHITKSALHPLLSQWCEALVRALREPDGIYSDAGLKTAVLNVLGTLVSSMPKTMSTFAEMILTPIWETLTKSARLYVQAKVMEGGDLEEATDSDVCWTPGNFREMVQKGLPDLTYFLILYMQCTEDMVERWLEDAQQLVEDEDEEGYSYSVRTSAQDLLLSLAEEFEENGAGTALVASLERHLTESQKLREAGVPSWWKIHEACLFALGSTKHNTLLQIKTGALNFDVARFLTTVAMPDMGETNYPILQGRCLWVTSRFIELLPSDMVRQLLTAVVQGLQPHQPPCIRVAAIRAVGSLSLFLSTRTQNPEFRDFLNQCFPSILENMVSFASDSGNSVLCLLLSNLCPLLALSDTFVTAAEERVAKLALDTMFQNSGDPELCSICQDVFRTLCRVESTRVPLQLRLAPILITFLNQRIKGCGQATSGPARNVADLQAAALDLLAVIVRQSHGALVPITMEAFLAAVHCTLSSQDEEVLEAGGDCVRAFVSEAPEKVFHATDANGRSGMSYAVQVATLLLDPNTSDISSSDVGRLVTTILNKMGDHLGESLDLLLRSVLSKMQAVASNFAATQGLILVFIRLMADKLNAVLDFLSTVPGPTGCSALEYVMTEWMGRAPSFFGAYDRKVSVVGMCKVLEHGLATGDPRLASIAFDEEVPSPEQGGRRGVRTRSQRVIRYTPIPLLSKIIKVLIYEFSPEGGCAANGAEGSSEDSGDDENRGNLPSGLLDLVDDGDEMDPDVVADPIWQLDKNKFIQEFLSKLIREPKFQAGGFAVHLTQSETQVLVALNQQ
ncbi:unnamed protein product [Cyprideis torosa]|uniref:Uncharacterized protein n=1 Tax=Cyprideis torosa TaxID=163714 RepID=A0A7R8ZK11_9CRUS|nr:unnamed protein product [Cyprideis torosa]CAG0888327.1 unnamed protein product [Cyprideis torosa]